MIAETKSKFSVKAGLQASSFAAIGIAFKEENLSLAANYDSRVSATIDPRVKLEGARMVVSAECERLIGYDVSPAWLLISDSDWRNAMKEDLLLRVKEELAASPAVTAASN